MKALRSATAFAPATVANVAVGFDLLGFPIEAVGDEVTVVRAKKAGVRVAGVEWVRKDWAVAVPEDPARNTAAVALRSLLEGVGTRLSGGFEIRIRKGIPLGSGMGGSAASAVGAVVAANAFLDDPLSKEELFVHALRGEEAASGAPHGDNVAPCLFGGLVVCRSVAPPDIVSVPVPNGVFCALVRPHAQVSTREARKILMPDVPMDAFVRQTAALAGVIVGCFTNDVRLIARSLADHVIEPQRAKLIPGFAAAREAALREEALGCSISGSGPSVFAWALSVARAESVRRAMAAAFEAAGVKADSWVSRVSWDGAVVRSTSEGP